MTDAAVTVLALGLSAAAVPPLVASAYLAALAALSLRPTPSRAASPAPTTRFDVLVPAHDEEEGIARTVASLRALDYPAAMVRTIVVADNCTDATALRALEAGAVVWERDDPARRGKGYALAYGFTASAADGFADAVVVIDADTSATPNLLRAFDAALAAGRPALQANYGVRNADDSWRTRLVTLGFTLFHDVRSVARERLGLSCGLRGNGMCFSADLLRRVPHRAFSIVEDLEYGIQLAHAGVRVAYVHDAHVYGDMPSTTAAAGTQRARWERGRRSMRRRHAGALVRAALARRDPILLDIALDVALPPLSRLVAVAAAGFLLALVAMMGLGREMLPAVLVWASALVALAGYVARGCAMAGIGAGRAIRDLAWAPVYVLWKFTLNKRSADSGMWVRTARADVPREELS